MVDIGWAVAELFMFMDGRRTPDDGSLPILFHSVSLWLRRVKICYEYHPKVRPLPYLEPCLPALYHFLLHSDPQYPCNRSGPLGPLKTTFGQCLRRSYWWNFTVCRSVSIQHQLSKNHGDVLFNLLGFYVCKFFLVSMSTN